MDTDFRSHVFGWQLVGRAGQALKEGRVYHPQAKVVTPQITPRMTNANRASSKWDGNEMVLPVLWASIVPLTAAEALRAIKPAAKASTRNGTCCRHRKVNLARTEAFAWWSTKSWPTPSIALTLVIFTLRGESSKKCVHRSIRHLNSSLQLDKSQSICFIVNITVARDFFGKHLLRVSIESLPLETWKTLWLVCYYILRSLYLFSIWVFALNHFLYSYLEHYCPQQPTDSFHSDENYQVEEAGWKPL